MDLFKTVGAFSWAELTTPNPAAATEFYGKLFGWTFQTMDMGSGPYHVIKIGDDALGGVMNPPPGAPPMPPHWGSYVTVAQCDDTAALCASLGGKVLVPPMDIPTVGRMAVIQDPQGALISVISYLPGPA
jgi:predicted enzyme related to lactoylglutathione lyase